MMHSQCIQGWMSGFLGSRTFSAKPGMFPANHKGWSAYSSANVLDNGIQKRPGESGSPAIPQNESANKNGAFLIVHGVVSLRGRGGGARYFKESGSTLSMRLLRCLVVVISLAFVHIKQVITSLKTNRFMVCMA